MYVNTRIKSRIAMAKAAFSKKRALFTSKLDLSLKRNPAHLVHRFCGAESRTLQKLDQKYLQRIELWCWRRVEKISCTDCMRNENVSQGVK
jgi:hypothetical protein